MFVCNFLGLNKVEGEVEKYDVATDSSLFTFRGGAELKIPCGCHTSVGKALLQIGLLKINSAEVNFHRGSVTIKSEQSSTKAVIN